MASIYTELKNCAFLLSEDSKARKGSKKAQRITPRQRKAIMEFQNTMKIAMRRIAASGYRLSNSKHIEQEIEQAKCLKIHSVFVDSRNDNITLYCRLLGNEYTITAHKYAVHCYSYSCQQGQVTGFIRNILNSVFDYWIESNWQEINLLPPWRENPYAVD